MAKPLLQVEDLNIVFETGNQTIHAVNGVSFRILPGETFGLVGESGCGKSVTALSLMRLVPSPPGKILSGRIVWDGRDLLSMPTAELIRLRGSEIGMIFQEPMTSFNPVQTIGSQIAEVLAVHEKMPPKEARELVVEILAKVGFHDPSRQVDAYPHQLSGGMRQRAMIAMALICHPKLLIADEPTTALDVTIQAQILELLCQLQEETGMAILMITHNLGIVAETADRVAVMYGGKVVETAPVRPLFREARHPYTVGLLKSVPGYDETGNLYAIPGQIPDMTELPPGCLFAARCHRATEVCRQRCPELKEVAPGHWVACWLY